MEELTNLCFVLAVLKKARAKSWTVRSLRRERNGYLKKKKRGRT